MESDKKLLFKSVIEYFAYAAIAIQAVFAAFWLFKNMGVLQSDYVAHTYIQAAESLKVDDSMGILYALVVRLFGHRAVLQSVQIVLVSTAVFFFSLQAFEKKAGLLIALLTVTNPLILQAETAVSPNALALGCVLLAITFALKSSQNPKWYFGLFGVAILAGFLNPDYAFLFIIVEVIFVIVRSIRTKKFELLLTGLCVVAFVVPFLTNGAIRDDYAYGRVHRDFNLLAFQRVVWPNLSEYEELFEYLDEAYTGEKGGMDYRELLAEADRIPENLSMELAYKLEKRIGAGNANTIYRFFVNSALSRGFGYWGQAVVRDEVLYFFSPASSAVAFMKQKTDTSVPGGLSYVFEGSPMIFKIYFMFSSAVALLFTLMYIVKGIGERVIGKKEPGSALAFYLIGIIVLVSLYATFVCVREYDYRNVLFMIMGWPAAAMALTERRKNL